MNMERLPNHLVARITISDSGCWLTGYALNHGGYAPLTYQGQKWLAHRLSYTLLVGPISEGLTIHHQCFTPSCCNPDHLEVVTNAENVRLSRLAGRFPVKTYCDRGHPLSGGNLYIRPNGHRQCRACNRDAVNRYKNRIKQGVSA